MVTLLISRQAIATTHLMAGNHIRSKRWAAPVEKCPCLIAGDDQHLLNLAFRHGACIAEQLGIFKSADAPPYDGFLTTEARSKSCSSQAKRIVVCFCKLIDKIVKILTYAIKYSMLFSLQLLYNVNNTQNCTGGIFHEKNYSPYSCCCDGT